MAEAITAVAAWALEAVHGAIYAVATPVVGPAAAATTANLLAPAIVFSATVAISVGASMALAPDIPDPDHAATPVKQTNPPRQGAYGQCRLSGAVMLYEPGTTNDSYAHVVVALVHCGGTAIDSFVHMMLNDDIVVADVNGYLDASDGAYSNNDKVLLLTSLGANPETSYFSRTEGAGGTGDAPPCNKLTAGEWTAAHRGDGQTSMFMRAASVDAGDFAGTYPNGLPQPNAVIKGYKLYDWRDVAQDIDDPATWEWSNNPVLILADYLCHAEHGMGFDFATRIQPALSYWTSAANLCEVTITTAAGLAATYTCGGMYKFNNAPADVIARILESFDGYMAQRGDGAFVLYAGEYIAPTVTFTDDHVIEYSVQRFVEDESAANVLEVEYCSPDHKYTMVPTEPWRDESDILIRGEKPQTLSLPWVQTLSQARRLAKRRMSRLTAGCRGTVTTNLYGLAGRTQRYLKLQISEVGVLNDIVVEVVEPPEIDLNNLTVKYSWVQADPDIDDWDYLTEEGAAPAVDETPSPPAPPPPPPLPPE